MIYAVTGHRPNKLGGYSKEVRAKLAYFMKDFLSSLKPDSVYTGMAQGLDQAVAWACWSLNIPYIAAIPCEDHDKMWPDEAKERYKIYLSHASSVILLSPGPYAAWKMQARNEYMVDHCDHLLALWDGSPGGTANCVNYAIKKGVPWSNLWPKWTGV